MRLLKRFRPTADAPQLQPQRMHSSPLQQRVQRGMFAMAAPCRAPAATPAPSAPARRRCTRGRRSRGPCWAAWHAGASV